jgi:hypothetical protein
VLSVELETPVVQIVGAGFDPLPLAMKIRKCHCRLRYWYWYEITFWSTMFKLCRDVKKVRKWNDEDFDKRDSFKREKDYEGGFLSVLTRFTGSMCNVQHEHPAILSFTHFFSLSLIGF